MVAERDDGDDEVAAFALAAQGNVISVGRMRQKERRDQRGMTAINKTTAVRTTHGAAFFVRRRRTRLERSTICETVAENERPLPPESFALAAFAERRTM